MRFRRFAWDFQRIQSLLFLVLAILFYILDKWIKQQKVEEKVTTRLNMNLSNHWKQTIEFERKNARKLLSIRWKESSILHINKDFSRSFFKNLRSLRKCLESMFKKTRVSKTCKSVTKISKTLKIFVAVKFYD